LGLFSLCTLKNRTGLVTLFQTNHPHLNGNCLPIFTDRQTNLLIF
jgi:hypothetical protein